VLYVASRDGRFYALNPYVQADRHLWARQTDGPLTAEFHVDDRGCFVGGEDFNLYAFDRLDGTLLWVYRTQGSLRQPVQVGKQTVFQYADRDRFHAVDIARGEKRWELPDGRIVLAVAEPYAYVLTAERKVRVVHEATGQERLAFPMTGLDLFVPNAAKPVLYAASRAGRFVCITPASTKHLTPKMLSDRPAP
jgi:hypothetical protein